MKKNELKNNGIGKNENLTELVFILDRSGSMSGLETDVVGGFNSLIKKQKEQEGECLVTTVLFSNDSETLHDRVALESVPEMRAEDFGVGGCTALIDAIGGAVEHIAAIHKYARPEDVPAHVVFAIMTDGMENASRRFSSKQVKRRSKSAGRMAGSSYSSARTSTPWRPPAISASPPRRRSTTTPTTAAPDWLSWRSERRCAPPARARSARSGERSSTRITKRESNYRPRGSGTPAQKGKPHPEGRAN